MGASCLQRAFHERSDRTFASLAASEGRQHPPMSHSLTSLAWENRHLGPARRVAADRRVDDPSRSRRGAPDKREIAALERAGATMVGELLGESAMRLIGLGDDHQPARILVEAMHDAGPRHPADAREALAAMGDQRIDESSLPVAGAGVHDEAGRLVDHDQRVVLVEDVERDLLRTERGRGRWWKLEREAVARFDPIGDVLYGRAA